MAKAVLVTASGLVFAATAPAGELRVGRDGGCGSKLREQGKRE